MFILRRKEYELLATKHTTYEKYLRKRVLEMYWDGEENPSVRVPFGDFFGIGHANDQGNDYSSVAYWYQLEPHKALPELPDVNSRLPKRWPEHGLWDC